MESHNHPSFIEPYQGAATGVGGILRDVFTMGARPIAAMNALRFGAPDHPKTRHLVAGVVAGIGGYGNSFGVPTVGGEVNFHRGYNGNILVNAFAAGIARTDAIFYSKASGVGLPVVYLGSKTGRDGIHGASMASAEFDDDIRGEAPDRAGRRPLLREAAARGLPRADGDRRRRRDPGHGRRRPHLLGGRDGRQGRPRHRARPRQGALPRDRHDRLRDDALGEPGAHADGAPPREGGRRPRRSSANGASISPSSARPPTTSASASSTRARSRPTCRSRISATRRPNTTGRYVRAEPPAAARPESIPAPSDCGDALLRILDSPDMCSRRWVWEQYDHLIGGNTVAAPRRRRRASSASTATARASPSPLDVTPRYCAADPFEGGKQAVAECWRNLTAVGAEPLAVTDNLNFGNPEKPEIMGELVGAIKGIGEACRALDFPVVSGNVSLYNETNGAAIPPTPGDRRRRPARRRRPHRRRIAFKAEGEAILLVGAPPAWGTHLGQSIYLREIARPRGRPAAAGRSRPREARRRLRPRPDPRRPRHRRARPAPTAASPWRSPRWRWPRASARRSTSSNDVIAGRGLLRRGPGPLPRHRAARRPRRHPASAPTRPASSRPGSAIPAARDLKLGDVAAAICCCRASARGAMRAWFPDLTWPAAVWTMIAACRQGGRPWR